LRSWINAGAKDDSGAVRVTLPDIKPRVAVHAPIGALAYRPDGKLLAAGGNREIVLLDPEKGEVIGTLAGPSGRVTALGYCPDGRHLAAASGSVGVTGEVLLYTAAPAALPGPQPAHRITAHRDLIHDFAFSPDGK